MKLPVPEPGRSAECPWTEFGRNYEGQLYVKWECQTNLARGMTETRGAYEARMRAHVLLHRRARDERKVQADKQRVHGRRA